MVFRRTYRKRAPVRRYKRAGRKSTRGPRTIIHGHGSYKINQNSLLMDRNAPVFSTVRNDDGSIRIRHREYIADIISAPVAGAFAQRTVQINPALSLFPWLNNVAASFQQWCCHGMAFHFNSTSANALNSVNTALGTCHFASQYNSNDKILPNKQAVLNQQYSQSCKSSESMMHYIECDPKITNLQSFFFVHSSNRNTALAEDLRFENIANLQISTVGQQGTSVNLGEMWITYDITLSKPKKASIGTFISTSLQGDNYVIPANGVTGGYFFGALPVQSNTSNIGTVLSKDTIFFPIGFFGIVQIIYLLDDAGAPSFFNVTMTGNNGATTVNLIDSDTLSSVEISNTTNLVAVAYFEVVDMGTMTPAYIVFTAGGQNSNATWGNLQINTIAYSN